MNCFNTLGVMLDCSRNAVMNVDSVKKFATTISKMGYNMLMLYTEDTYEVDNQPLFGHMRGRYTKQELKDLSKFCDDIGIELVPCIQTLAHLNCMFKWYDTYNGINDCSDILLAGNEDTYKLIDDMFSTISQCFLSKRIHIGMDEAYMVGLGKYLEKNGYHNRFEIINNHLKKVCKIAEKYNLSPMIWSDMFCKFAFGNEDYYESTTPNTSQKSVEIPENVSLVYWDYYSTDYNRYYNNIGKNQSFGRQVYFAGGAWSWKGFAPDNQYSLDITLPALKACRDGGVKDAFITMWGDDGAECSRFSLLPSLMYAAEVANGNTDLENIKLKFQNMFGMEFDSFLLLDKLDKLGKNHDNNPSKYLLYNDIFNGINDFRCTKEDSEYYCKLKTELENVASEGEYKYIYDTLINLCNVLSIKADLGVRVRTAYKEKNMKELDNIATVVMPELLNRIEKFYLSFEKQWFIENKPNGFDVQDIRIGGLKQRILSCQKRLVNYIDGKVTNIPELETENLPAQCFKCWSRVVTPNVVSHIF